MDQKNKILGRVMGKQAAGPIEFIKQCRHIVMKTYGWIPHDEYYRMPAQDLIDMLDCISDDLKHQNKNGYCQSCNYFI